MSKRTRERLEAARRKELRLRARTLRAAAPKAPSALVCDAAEVDWVAAAGDAEGTPKRFTMVAYTGGRMRPMGFYHDVVVDLAGCRVMPGKRPSYLDHDRAQRVGHTTSIAVEGNRITVEGVVSGASPAAREVVESAAQGFPWRSSIGGPIEQIEFIDKGQKAAANGQNFVGPLHVVRAMRLAEISFVSMPGDESSRAQIAAEAANQGETTMGFEAWLAAGGFDPAALTDTQRGFLRAQYDAEVAEAAPGAPTTPPAPLAASAPPTPPPAPTPDPAAELRAAAAAESRRIASIRQVVARYGVTEVEVGEGTQRQRVQLEAHAIEQGWTHAEAELHALRASRPAAGPAIHDRSGQRREHAAAALEGALCLSAGMGEEQAMRGLAEPARELAASGDYRGVGIHAVMHEVIQAAGRYAPAGRVNDEFLRSALHADRELRAAGNATVSLAGILGNVANKTLLAAYRSVPDVVHQIAAKASNSNFHPHTRYRLDGDATFLEVGADGELKSFEVDEESYSAALKTFGRIIQLNRQQMINDDLGAFLQLPRILGRGAGLARNKAVFATLLGGIGSFFTTGNKNYFSGAATNLQVSSLTTAEQMFREFVDKSGNPIDVMPKTLLVGPGNAVNAKQLFADQFVNESTTTDKGKPSGNPHRGMYEPVITPWLSSAKIAGASATVWGLFADPADVPALEVAYLNGSETPVLQSSEADFDHLGMKWRSYWDFGVALANKTGAVISKGAA